MQSALLHLVRGFLMGSADVVPGVSGGTVALVVGIYRRLITNIRAGARVLGALTRGNLGSAKSHFVSIEWSFLLPLLAGIVVALVSLAHVIEHQLEENPVELSALFFGLVAASSWVAWGLLVSPDRRHLLIAAAVAVVAFLVMGFRSGEASDPAEWTFVAAGAVAICAMILPGVSGSFILVMLGMYEAILGAVNERDVTTLLLVALGAVIGLALFSSLLNWALDHYHDWVMAAIVGLLLGSLRVLWPWPNGIDGPELGWPSASDLWLPLGLAAVGALAILGLTAVARRRIQTTGARV